MEFNIKKRGKDFGNYDQVSVDLARKFTKRIYDEFGGFLKAVILFGSTTKKKSNGDIDILVIVDDVSLELTRELAQSYRIIVEKAVAEVSTQLHITTLRFSSFWEYLRAGDPIAINMLRDGAALLDYGFVDPLQFLLRQGRIRPTSEAVWNYFMKSPHSLTNSKNSLQKAIVDLYWAVMDSSHAALMSMGETPPSPKHVPDMLREKMVPKKLIPSDYPKLAEELYNTMKMIEKRNVESIKGSVYDKYYNRVTKFVNTMKKIVQDNELKQ